MKKYLIYLMMAAAIVTFGACSPKDEHEPQTPDIENPEKPDDGREDTPDAAHLTGEGLTSGRINEQNISSWLREIGLIE